MTDAPAIEALPAPASALTPVSAPVTRIRADRGTQARAAGLDRPTVDRYAGYYREGIELPAIDLYEATDADGEPEFYPGDGHTRLAAQLQLGRTHVLAFVHPGGRAAAIRHSAGANETHGLARSDADRWRAVTMLLDEPDERVKSNHQLAEIASVSVSFVGKVRAKWDAQHSTVVGEQSAVRLGKDGRAINTANIGKSTPKIDTEKPGVKWFSSAQTEAVAALSWIDRYKALRRDLPEAHFLFVQGNGARDRDFAIALREDAKRAASPLAGTVFKVDVIDTEFGLAVMEPSGLNSSPLMDRLAIHHQVWTYIDPGPEVKAFFTHHMRRVDDAARQPEPAKTLTVDVQESPAPAYDLKHGDRVIVPDGRKAIVTFVDDGDQVKVSYPGGHGSEWFDADELKPAPVDDTPEPPASLAADAATITRPGEAPYTLRVGDQVTTRTGHTGEIVAINGAHASVRIAVGTGAYRAQHKLSDLERVLSTAPPAGVSERLFPPPDDRPLAVGDRVSAPNGEAVERLEGVIETISANRALVRVDGDGVIQRRLDDLRRVEAAATVVGLQSDLRDPTEVLEMDGHLMTPAEQADYERAAGWQPAAVTRSVFADLAPLPWTRRGRELIDAAGQPVGDVARGLESVAAELVKVVNGVNAPTGEEPPALSADLMADLRKILPVIYEMRGGWGWLIKPIQPELERCLAAVGVSTQAARTYGIGAQTSARESI